jgi:hypothetical protein
MAYNYGNVGIINVTSGGAVGVNLISAPANGAVRVFDMCLLTTAAAINLISGQSDVGAAITTANTLIRLDNNFKTINSNAGIRFIGGVIVSSTTLAGNLATISYIKEF